MTVTEPIDQTIDDERWRIEQRRRAVLTDLGIQPLVSRFDPPGAHPAVRLLPPQPAPDDSPRGQVDGSSVRQLPPSKSAGGGAEGTEIARLREHLVAGQAPTGQVAAPTPRATAAPRPESGVETETFQLLLATAGRWLWVEALPDGLVRREQLQLIQAMARALDGPAVKVAHRQFDWPMADHPHLPRDLESARQSVHGQIQRLAREANATGLVVLGGEAQRYLTELPGLLSLNIPATVAMLDDPGCKRQAWQILKPHAGGG